MSYGRYGLFLIALTTVYFLSAQAGLFIAVFYGDVTPLWPPSGIAVAIFWLMGWRWWPVIVLGETLIAISLNQSVITGLWGSSAQLIEAFIAVKLIEFFNLSPKLKSFQDNLFFFGAIAIIAPAASGLIGAGNLLLLKEITTNQFLQTSVTWWLGDTLGILVITPLITCWWHQRPPLKIFLERWLLSSLIIVGAFIAFFYSIPDHSNLLFFLLLPYVTYSAITLGNQGASLSLVVLTTIVLGEGLLVPTTDFALSVKMAFIGTCALSSFLMAALFYEKNLARIELLEEKNKAETTLFSISDGVITTNIDGKVLFLNDTAEAITGWNAGSALGCDILEVCPLFDGEASDTKLHPVSTFLSREAEDEDHYLYRFPNKDSELRVIDARIKSWKRQDQIAGTVIVLRDITDEKVLKDELTYQANHDEITGLANRRAFNSKLKHTLAELNESQRYTLLYIDLDQFKLINDTCGHEIGDLMLIEIAALISNHVNDGGMAARISGDEFGIILPIDNEPHALAIAESIRRSILDYRYHHEDLIFSVGASIGLTYIHPQDSSANAVLSRADIACYQAKETGRNKISTYHAEDIDMLRYQGEIEWISQLKRALMRNQFTLYRQGIHRLDQAVNQCSHYEILIRLNQKDTLISPASFLPIAERFGFMPVIDRWVTEKTFQYLHANPNDKATYNINLCGNSLNDKNFFADIKALAKREQIDTSRICFEVTERVALQDLDEICDAMQDMIALGFKFALDDFGSGVANHSYLEKLPIQYVKLDGQFVRSLHQDKTSQIIVESLAKIALLKNMQCIAEWIEDDSTIATLQKIGIQYGQGFWFDKPVPLTTNTNETLNESKTTNQKQA
ncbi:MAG: EAL domain-containing protein [Pseudomonadales bacterium]|nr:EAL domain-containing protein [Pseudomonadales bacterium]